MIRLLTILISSVIVLEANCQLYTGNETSILLGVETQMNVSGQAYLNGAIENNGLIEFQHDVDFGTISDMGNLSLSGTESQSLFGTSLTFSTLSVNNESSISLFLDTVEVTQSMDLLNGIVYTNGAILNSVDNVSGGSKEAFIEGSLLIKKTSAGNQTFPMGKDGSYNPFTLSDLPKNSEIIVTMVAPDLYFTITSDTLIDIFKELGWQIDYKGEKAISTPSLSFNGVNLSTLITDSTIRAPEYKPLIAYLSPDSKNFHPLRTSILSETDDRTFGYIQAGQSLLLDSANQYLFALGLQPASSKLQFYVPNIFAPGSFKDTNRNFKPFLQGTTINSFEITIWDQFNNVVFQEAYLNPDMNLAGWDGSLANGKEAPQGTYFYSVVLKSTDGDFNRKSTVFLAR